MEHSFSQAPTADIPRSSFDRSHGLKTTFNAGELIPIFVDEALPGDTLSINPTLFARINTPLYPLMDNIFLDVHFFSVPNRLVWDNFRKFMGEQTDPNDSTDYTVPRTQTSTWGEQSMGDYFGIPTKKPIQTSALPFRAYNLIYNEWYRDQNLIDSANVQTGDSPDNASNYPIRKRGKRHDYFTSCLPWLQKGDAVNIPLGDQAPIQWAGSLDNNNVSIIANNVKRDLYESDGANRLRVASSTGTGQQLYADLSNATASTVNELRRAFQIQKLLERDARSGTRYAEIVKAHFGVNFMDVTYRPEFLGGTSSQVQFESVPMTANNSSSQATGDLAAMGTVTVNGGGFTKSFTEHCTIIGIASVRADLTYQQGLDRMWSRETRYDYYFPALAHIGEQAVLNKEIYFNNNPGDNDVFGYQERWAEYRYKPSKVTGQMRSNATQSLDAWHLSQEFGSLPALNQAFIEENVPMDRVVTFTDEPDFHMDAYFNYRCARPMPLFSVPGLIDHF